MRITFIINSLSSKYKSIGHSIEAAKAKYPEVQINAKSTKSAGDAFRIAHQIMTKDQAEVLIACGGDGTVNEVLNGVSFANTGKEMILGVYPAGSANGLVKTIGSKTIDQLIQAAISKSYETYDIGLMAHDGLERRFINVSSAGMGGLVFRQVESTRGSFTPRLNYMFAIFRCILAFVRPKVRITMDGESQELFISAIIVGNGKYLGYGLGFTPQASMEDEGFGLTILRHSSYFQLITKYWKISGGEEVDHTWISYHNAKNIKIEVLEGRLPMEADGEYFDVLDPTESISYSVQPMAVKWL